MCENDETSPLRAWRHVVEQRYDSTATGWETHGKILIPTQTIKELGKGNYAAGKALLDRILTRMSDEPAPPKPFGEAVADSWRGIKDWYNGPETSQKTDPSVREHVNAEVDRQIKSSEKQKPFPGILP